MNCEDAGAAGSVTVPGDPRTPLAQSPWGHNRGKMGTGRSLALPTPTRHSGVASWDCSRADEGLGRRPWERQDATTRDKGKIGTAEKWNKMC